MYSKTENHFKLRLLSSLQKVFAEKEPTEDCSIRFDSMLKNEIFSFQVGVCNIDYADTVNICVNSDLKDSIRVRQVLSVPSMFAAYPNFDDHYIKTESGLYPDLLRDIRVPIRFGINKWASLWIDIEPNSDVTAGNYPIEICLLNQNDEVIDSISTTIEIINADLGKQTLIHTEWFHTDCLANYYNVKPFSEEHWTAITNFINIAAKRGINMILTPIFTPSLDTAVGGERTTVQLTDVYLNNGKYSFGFDRLDRWIDICKSAGIEYLEIAHFFTQWGAKCAPKVMAYVDGEYKKLFGWETSATSDEYREFLQIYIPALLERLKAHNIDKNCVFHISDEPSINQLEDYRAAKAIVEDALKGYKIIDALSNYEFYETGIIKHPVIATNHIEPFLKNNVPDLWVYYCCGQSLKVSNRFFSMPSQRNRIIGLQLYKYNIKGFLHWGYNFYNSCHSIESINPYNTTDAVLSFPSGDAFLVYPGANFEPEESIRFMVFFHALQDLRALELLESLTSKQYVIDLLEEGLTEEITFSCYPKSDTYFILLRNKINREIKKYIK